MAENWFSLPTWHNLHIKSHKASLSFMCDGLKPLLDKHIAT